MPLSLCSGSSRGDFIYFCRPSTDTDTKSNTVRYLLARRTHTRHTHKFYTGPAYQSCWLSFREAKDPLKTISSIVLTTFVTYTKPSHLLSHSLKWTLSLSSVQKVQPADVSGTLGTADQSSQIKKKTHLRAAWWCSWLITVCCELRLGHLYTLCLCLCRMFKQMMKRKCKQAVYIVKS